jgi:glycosyltransferase involved in cell wall biosynthesis
VVGQGEGTLRDELMALRSELGLTDVVRFEGFREDIERVFRAIDAYVVSSSSEGFSLTTVQAMATRVPVVSTRCGGPEEILADGGGLLVPHSRPEELAAALERLFRSRSLGDDLGSRGLAIARKRFGRDRMAGQYEALYEECIAQAAGADR